MAMAALWHFLTTKENTAPVFFPVGFVFFFISLSFFFLFSFFLHIHSSFFVSVLSFEATTEKKNLLLLCSKEKKKRMSGRIVRQSKFRNVFAQPAKPEQCFTNTKLTATGWDSNFISANAKYFGLLWKAGGGGVFAVFRHDQPCKLSDVPLVSVHKSAVLDLDWSPFNDQLIASCSEDCNVCITQIPEEGVKANITEPVQTLRGHKRKVGTVNFHPSANNVLATSASDFTVKLWDIEKGDEMFSVSGHTDIVQSCSWNKDGSLIASACRDKKLRIFDPRKQESVGEVVCHQGVKGLRCCWMTDKDKIVTTGFTKTIEREFSIWDPRNLATAVAHQVLDTQSGVVMPFYDPDTSILFLAGKGDGNIRFYEIVDDKPFFYYINQHGSSSPQRGMCMLPKRAMNVSACEIARLLKAENNRVEPISFIVPRKSELYQDDLYPDAISGIPAMTADEWKEGKNADPDRSYSMAPGFVAAVHPADFHPVLKEAPKEEKPKTEKELKDEIEELKKHVAYLETELAKKDAQIKDLQAAAKQ